MFYHNNKYIASFDEFDAMIERFKKMPDVLYLDSDISEGAMEELFIQAKRKQISENSDAPAKTPIEFLLYFQTKIEGNTVLYKDYQYLSKRIGKVINHHLELIDTSEVNSKVVKFSK